MQAFDPTGWYGKLPTLGDFASRRLPPSFIEPWDDWLARGLAAWREQSPDGWLDGYLASPSWRFVLMPGVIGEPSTAWAGVLMPSVDRVGRYFPLTLVRVLPALPADAAQADDLLGWLQRLDDVALDALHDDWPAERLDTELARLGGWTAQAAAAGNVGLPTPWTRSERVDVQPQQGVAALLASSARDALLQGLHGKALWLSDAGEVGPLLRITAGLPSAAEFSAFVSRTAGRHASSNPIDLGGTP